MENVTVEQINAIIAGILQVVGALAALAAALPYPSEKRPALLMARKIIDVFAFNVFNAKNKKSP